MIERDELLKMAREAHGQITGDWFDMDIAALYRLKDAILERAASRIENVQSEHTPTDCAYMIRALKTKEKENDN